MVRRIASGPQGTPDGTIGFEYEVVAPKEREYRFILAGVVKQEVVPGRRAKLTLTDLKTPMEDNAE